MYTSTDYKHVYERLLHLTPPVHLIGQFESTNLLLLHMNEEEQNARNCGYMFLAFFAHEARVVTLEEEFER